MLSKYNEVIDGEKKSFFRLGKWFIYNIMHDLFNNCVYEFKLKYFAITQDSAGMTDMTRENELKQVIYLLLL